MSDLEPDRRPDLDLDELFARNKQQADVETDEDDAQDAELLDGGSVLEMAQAGYGETDAPTASERAYDDSAYAAANASAQDTSEAAGEEQSHEPSAQEAHDSGAGAPRSLMSASAAPAPASAAPPARATSSRNGGFLGFGAQFDTYSYTDPKINHRKLDPKVRKLGAEHVRIFVPLEATQTNLLGQAGPDWLKINIDKLTQELAADPQNAQKQKALQKAQQGYAKAQRYVGSFVNTVALAGPQATINLTFSGAVGSPYRIEALANIIRHLSGQGFGKLQVTLQNEPNGPDQGDGFRGRFNKAIKRKDRAAADAAAAEYVDAYKRLDQHLETMQLRERVQIVGGDMVSHNRKAFFEAIVRQGLNEFVDAYSFHVYWGSNKNHSFKSKLAQLGELKRMVNKHAPGMSVQITEYGRNRAATKAERKKGAHGVLAAEKGVQAAFQQGLYALSAVNVGFTGVVKWDAFYSGTRVKGDDRGNGGDHEMIEGPNANYATDETYSLLRMFTHATDAGWIVDGTNHGTRGAESHFKSADGQDGAVIAMSASGRTISTRGLPQGKPLYVMIWNKNGKGDLRQHKLGNDRTIEVPENGAVAISTKQL